MGYTISQERFYAILSSLVKAGFLAILVAFALAYISLVFVEFQETLLNFAVITVLLAGFFFACAAFLNDNAEVKEEAASN